MAGNAFEIIAGDEFGAGFKVCKTCGEEKPLGEFHKDTSGYLGRKAHCKACINPVNAAAKRKVPVVDRQQALENAYYRAIKDGII